MTIVLVPPAFLLTTAVFSPVLIELGGDLVRAFSVAYANRSGGALPAMLGEGGPPAPPSGGSGSPEPNMGIPGGGGTGA